MSQGRHVALVLVEGEGGMAGIDVDPVTVPLAHATRQLSLGQREQDIATRLQHPLDAVVDHCGLATSRRPCADADAIVLMEVFADVVRVFIIVGSLQLQHLVDELVDLVLKEQLLCIPDRRSWGTCTRSRR